MCNYTTQILTATISLADFMASYRDVNRIEAYCRACDNYGRYWSCPPFSYDVEQRLCMYSEVTLIALRVNTTNADISWREWHNLLLPERIHFEQRLRQLESLYNGWACNAGGCVYCQDNTCTRSCNTPCRHPQLMRPSLEAYGFDVSRAMNNLLGLPLQWAHGNTSPEYISFVAALFHNVENLSLAQFPEGNSSSGSDIE